MNIDNWTSFKDFINLSIQNHKPLYYRGQLNPKWKLQTSFHRYAEKNNITIFEYLNYAIPELQYHIIAHENDFFDLDNEKEFGAFLGKLQHYGFPTPLLDWTLSPYVAAYFAFREVNSHNPQVEKVKIFVFDFQEWDSHAEQVLNLRSEKQFLNSFRPFSKRNTRIIPQMGTTTVTNINNLETYIAEQEKIFNKRFLYHVTLPVSEMQEITNELNLMGINEMTLFPGVEGICTHFKNSFFNRADTKNTLKE